MLYWKADGVLWGQDLHVYVEGYSQKTLLDVYRHAVSDLQFLQQGKTISVSCAWILFECWICSSIVVLQSDYWDIKLLEGLAFILVFSKESNQELNLEVLSFNILSAFE